MAGSMEAYRQCELMGCEATLACTLTQIEASQPSSQQEVINM
jgi:hypothetical protein